MTIKCETKKGVENGFKDFDLSHWKDETVFK